MPQPTTYLTALEPEDLELLYTIENDRDVWSITSVNTPYSRFTLNEYLVNQQNDIYADKQLRLVVRNSSMEGIGLIDLFNFSPEHMRAEMGLAILAAQQGKGYASAAIRQLQEYCRTVLHLNQMYCIVPAGNIPSLTMLRNTGFTDETILRRWIRDSRGQWTDCILLHWYNTP